MNLTTQLAGHAAPLKTTRGPADIVIVAVIVAVIAFAAAWASLVAPSTRTTGAAAPVEFGDPVYVDFRRGERGVAATKFVDPIYVELRRGERGDGSTIGVGGSGSQIAPGSVRHAGTGGP